MGPLSIRHGTAQHVIACVQNEMRWVARVLARGTFLSHMAGRSLQFHSPVRFLFAFFSEPLKIRRPLQLSLTPTLTLHSCINLHWISSGLHWACITHCTTIICAILTIDDLEGREACRICSCRGVLLFLERQGACEYYSLTKKKNHEHTTLPSTTSDRQRARVKRKNVCKWNGVTRRRDFESTYFVTCISARIKSYRHVSVFWMSFSTTFRRRIFLKPTGID